MQNLTTTVGFPEATALLIADEVRQSPHPEHRGLRVSVDYCGFGEDGTKRYIVRGRCRATNELIVVVKGSNNG